MCTGLRQSSLVPNTFNNQATLEQIQILLFLHHQKKKNLHFLVAESMSKPSWLPLAVSLMHYV